MAHDGKNRAPRKGAAHITQPWFTARQKKSRARDRAAKLSRRRNRSSK